MNALMDEKYKRVRDRRHGAPHPPPPYLRYVSIVQTFVFSILLIHVRANAFTADEKIVHDHRCVHSVNGGQDNEAVAGKARRC